MAIAAARDRPAGREHLRTHRKDFHSRRGLIMLTNRRRKLLAYLKSSDLDRYNALLAKLNLRK